MVLKSIVLIVTCAEGVLYTTLRSALFLVLFTGKPAFTGLEAKAAWIFLTAQSEWLLFSSAERVQIWHFNYRVKAT
jgi:hypothetical protein